MRHWGFWDWVAYACLLVAAMIMAADTGFKLSPNVAAQLPHFVEGPMWGFAPLIFVLLATAILLFREYRGTKDPSQPGSGQTPAIPAGKAWVSGYDVFPKLADTEILQQRLAIEKQREEIASELAKIYPQWKSSPPQSVAEAEFEKRRDQLAATDNIKVAASELLWTKGWDGIRNRLASGELIAKGFRKPVAQNPDAVLIPSDYWRFLKFTDQYGTATGEGLSYTGVMVAEK